MKPLNQYTPTDMAARLRELAPAASVAADGNVVTARLDGVEVYLRATGEAIYGPGLGWGFDAMGPNEWDEEGPDEVVQQFMSGTRPERVVEWLGEHAWRERQASSTASSKPSSGTV